MEIIFLLRLIFWWRKKFARFCRGKPRDMFCRRFIWAPVEKGLGGGKKLIGMNAMLGNGMNAMLGKELKGNLYYLKPNILFALISGLVDNLIKQGFSKIYIITGHGGVKQVEVLKKIENKCKNVVILNPCKNLSVHAHHADENETSLFWACYPEEELKSRKIKIDSSDDFVKYQGYDAREKASLRLGKKLLSELIKNLSKRIF